MGSYNYLLLLLIMRQEMRDRRLQIGQWIQEIGEEINERIIITWVVIMRGDIGEWRNERIIKNNNNYNEIGEWIQESGDRRVENRERRNERIIIKNNNK